jgi:hypothetical protein
VKKKKRNKSNFWRFVSVIMVVSTAAVIFFWFTKEPDTINHSQEELQARYDYNLNHKSSTNVHQLLRPVYFSKGKYAAACGTMVLGKDEKPSFIVTASHLFSETDPGSDFYDYHVLGPSGFTSQGHLSRVVLDSLRTSSSPKGIQDIAICYIGDAGQISRTSKVIISASSPSQHDFSLNSVTPFRVTSVTTGEQFEIVGEAVNSVTNAFYVMLYESVNGESGSGFWKDESEQFPNGGGKLYVLSGDIAISQQTRRDLHIPAQYKRLTLMSAIQIKW